MKTINDFLKGFKEGIKKFGENISIIINSILLSLVYFIGVGLTSIFAKMIGKYFLDLEIKQEAKTYWVELNLGKIPIGEYTKQF